ncbi:NeuD/PglB/VioB family sugar acetyltransferase [Porphyromonas levii]|nr:NeuD/PglB/VioB family sugar acetyltransferase [Porphyromonas levii]TFH97124.1 hypothetical protein E4P48_02435 [Porphyromonas levii]
MNKFIIFGSGQHCRVVLYNAIAEGKSLPVVIADANLDKRGGAVEGIPIEGYDISNPESIRCLVEKYETNKFFIGFGNMKLRKPTFERLVSLGLEPINIIHPDAVVSPTARLGKGILIECGCLVTPSPVIGDNVVVNTGSQINHDNVVEGHVYIASGVILSGGVRIKENTLIDDGVIITLGKQVGSNCIIGAGAVVTKDIPDNSIAFGSPCKVIRENILD